MRLFLWQKIIRRNLSDNWRTLKWMLWINTYLPNILTMKKEGLRANIVMCFLLLRRNPYQPMLGLVKKIMISRLIHPHYVLNLIPTLQTGRFLCDDSFHFLLFHCKIEMNKSIKFYTIKLWHMVLYMVIFFLMEKDTLD